MSDVMSDDLPDLFLNLLAFAMKKPDPYDQLNDLRNRFNSLPDTGFDLYLEDNWNEPVEGQTHFEYRLRSLRTKEDLGPIGIDVYTNHQDGKGVWHLGDYQSSGWVMQWADYPALFDVSPGGLASGYAPISIDVFLAFLKTHRC